MTGLAALIERNCKLFFKDKGMFFTAMVTPLILLVLYATFLANVYRDAFISGLGDAIAVSEDLLDATVGGQLVSSLLAVSCVTVAFCSNLLMVQDKVTGARRDLTMTPVKSGVLAMGYYISTALTTLVINLVACGAGLIYLRVIGWYLSAADAGLLVLDVVLLSLFGTAFSSAVNFFLSSQGQISAVGTVISAGYGFICGAYMPISSFSAGLQKVLSFLPGTHGTVLMRNHTLNGVFREMEGLGFPAQVLRDMRDSIDCNLYFFGEKVTVPAMYTVLCGAIGILLGMYVLFYCISQKRKPRT